MRIKQRLLVAFLFITALILALSYGINSLIQERTETAFREISGEFLPASIALARMETELYRSLVLLHSYEDKLDVNSQAELEKAQSLLDTYKTTFDLYQKDSDLSLQIENQIQTFNRALARYVLLLQKEADKDSILLLRQEVDNELRKFTQRFDPLIGESLEKSYQKILEVDRLNNESKSILLFGGILILLLTFLVSLYIANRLSKPLSELRDAAYKIGSGNLEHSLAVKSEDEIGELAIEFNKMTDKLRNAKQLLLKEQEKLEDRVKDRTTELSETINELQITQAQLIETEKMAALGGLVSGVAHEINTPIGISITAATHLTQESKKIKKAVQDNKLKKSTLNQFINEVDEVTQILEANLIRGSELINNFKQVAVDHSVEEIRKINLSEYLNEVLSSLQPKWKNTKINLVKKFQPSVEIITYPGAIAQVISNLIVNSILHGFDDGKEAGEITIELGERGNNVIMQFTDTGKGMHEEILNKIFDPFFTTRRGNGGTGLGMHIVYNLIIQKLKGKILCASQPEKGCHVVIELPKVIQ